MRKGLLLRLIATGFLYMQCAYGANLEWLTDYGQALQLSKETSKPIILFFTGSDWCGWCNKLEREILETADFVQETENKLIFVKLDFPMRSALDSKTAQQNEQLQQKFSVRGFPTIVILDPDQQPIGVTGYRPGGGKQYAEHLMKIVNDYSAYKQQMQGLGAFQFSGRELRKLYQQACEFGLENDVNLLIIKGVDSDDSPFFLAERYRHLVHAGQIDDEETVALKEKLLKSDADNKSFTHYQIAVIEFEAYYEDLKKEKYPAELAVAPLMAYVGKYGTEDKENLWRVNMVISQVFLEKNRFPEALKYAKESYETAPSALQPEIALAIQNIQSHIKDNG